MKMVPFIFWKFLGLIYADLFTYLYLFYNVLYMLLFLYLILIPSSFKMTYPCLPMPFLHTIDAECDDQRDVHAYGEKDEADANVAEVACDHAEVVRHVDELVGLTKRAKVDDS